jgi:hypothetical protein
MSCCVFFLWISPRILAFLAHLFSSHDLHCVLRYSFNFCAFRILEYLLGYFLEIVCMKILFCLCAGLILKYLGHLDCNLCFYNSFASILASILNTTLFLELIGSNGIFGDISDWFWFKNTTSNGSQHNV